MIAAGTAAIMPYYGMPVGLEVDGEPIEEVGFGYNRQIVTGLLRERLGYDGVVVTDWELVNDNRVGDQVLPARAWGVEHLDPHGRMERILDAGADQFGGEECVDVLLDLVAQGRVPRRESTSRPAASSRSSSGSASSTTPTSTRTRQPRPSVGADFRDAGYAAQARSVTVLAERPARVPHRLLPLATGLRIYAENVTTEALGRRGITGRAAGGRRRRHRPAHGTVRAAVRPLPGVVVPPGLARLPTRPGRPAGRGSPRTARWSSTWSSTARRSSTPLLPFAAAVVGELRLAATSALLDALTGRIAAVGRLPIDLPRSMDQVRSHPEDVPGFDDPLFPFGHGLSIIVGTCAYASHTALSPVPVEPRPSDLAGNPRRLFPRTSPRRASRPRAGPFRASVWTVTTFGGSSPAPEAQAWDRHRVTPLLEQAAHAAVAVDLPGDDPQSGLPEYAALVESAIEGRDEVVLVGQSLGGFTPSQPWPHVGGSRAIVLLNAMIPVPGETPGQWREAVGQEEARVAAARTGWLVYRVSRPRHLLPARRRPRRGRGGRVPPAPRERGRPSGRSALLPHARLSPSTSASGADDRFFPLELQQRVARDRLRVEPDVVPGGHLAALSHPTQAGGIPARCRRNSLRATHLTAHRYSSRGR